MSYQIIYKEKFLEDLKKHSKSGQRKALNKIKLLIEELKINPYKGTGHPERLKGYKEINVLSRRITSKHRLIYEVKEEKVQVLLISSYGHYQDK